MSLAPYPKYKNSGSKAVGLVPDHWPTMRLRFAAQINPLKSEVADYPDSTEVAFFPMEAVGDDGSLSTEQRRTLAELRSGYTYFREGDVTLAKITPCFENGKGALMRPLPTPFGFGSTELTVLRGAPELLDERFLYMLTTSEPFRSYGEASMYGAGGQKRVPDAFVRDFVIGLPDRREQGQIVAFLDHETARIDALVEEQKRLIALLKEKRQAVISHAVTKGLDPNVPLKDSGVEWLGNIPAQWSVARVSELFDEVSEIGSSQLPVLQVSIHSGVSDRELSEDEYEKKTLRIEDREKYKRVRPGDLTYNMMRAWQGAFGAVTVDGQVSPAYVVARPSQLDLSRFVEWQLRSPCGISEMRRYSYGVADFRMRLYWEDFKTLHVAVPPHHERKAIMNHISTETESFRNLEEEAARTVHLLTERRSALISAAVTGKIDVRNWQQSDSSADIEQALPMAAEEPASYG